METPEIGDHVRIRSVLECERQGKYHGYDRYVKDLVGVIVPRFAHVPPPLDHPWRVDFGYDLSHGKVKPPHTSQYFSASEMEWIP